MMPPFSIPREIFDQLRRDLRAQSGIPSYDPTDPSVPNLQPYESCIARVDPSPPYLRCKHCKGRLLRGVNSAFCVFCGRERFGDAMPDPLNFRDTKGYAWLLEALVLDGSESVAPISAEDESYREKNKVKGEIPLSDLLSLEIKWSVQEEKPATSGKAESAQPKSSLNLGGVDLENFFIEGTKGISLAEAEKKQGADKGSPVFESVFGQAPDNLGLFGNVPPSSTAGNSTEYESRNSMSAWEAEFQSADSETAEKASLSVDPFAGSSVEMSAYMDAMFGSGNVRKGNKAKPSCSTENWFVGDPRGDSSFGFSGQDLGPKTGDNGGHSGVMEGPSRSLAGSNWMEDNQWLSNTTGAGKSDITVEDDTWNDFTSSTNAAEHSVWKYADSIKTPNPTPQKDSFGSSNDFTVDFGFSREDLFPSASKNSVKPVNLSSVQSNASALDGIINMESEGGCEEAVKQDGRNATSRESDQLQMLMSQMHELSFILDSNLSIPSLSGKPHALEK